MKEWCNRLSHKMKKTNPTLVNHLLVRSYLVSKPKSEVSTFHINHYFLQLTLNSTLDLTSTQ